MEKTKIIAFHLPQFHEFKENNEWWGDGFTEWTNTKKAIKLFHKHNQPREPLDDNYYDLSQYSTRKAQADLAKLYGIDGFCYYHYWFNGKLLMHKPIESLLKEQDINFPFCLCWANEPWTRAWDGGKKDILIEQNYSDKKDWKAHIDYLLKFFKDPRYICVDNKPLLVLYRTENILFCHEMVDYWKKECKKNGFEGIFIVEEFNWFQDKSYIKSDAVLQFEPMYTMRFKRSIKEKIINKVRQIRINQKLNTNISWYWYDEIWGNIIKRKVGQDMYLGAFVDWDNTARKGKNGTVVLGTSPEKFKYYFSRQYQRACEYRCPFLFINAWNEWAEGTYLEPDKVNGYKYLEVIRDVVRN